MTTVSAIPDNLVSYGVATIDMDSRLNLQGRRLQSAIDTLNNSGSDPSLLGPLPALGSQVASYATGNAGTDAWVGDVGAAFANADQGGSLPGQVVHAQQSVINALVKGEEPQGMAARGRQLLQAKAAGKNGFINLVPTGRAGLEWILHNQWWATWAWSGLAKGGAIPGLLAAHILGYKLVLSKDGRYVIAKGTRFLTGVPDWLNSWIKSGRLPGTRYLATNAEVSKFFSFQKLAGADLKAAANPFAREFYDASKLGGGAVALGLTVLGDIWDARKTGYGNHFVASVGVDTATTAGTVVAADAAGATAGSFLAGGEVGGELGTVVAPGVGTFVGFVVIGGVTYFFNGTGVGKAVRDDAIKWAATGLHYTEKGISIGYHAVSNVVTHPGQDAKTVWHAAGSVWDDATGWIP